MSTFTFTSTASGHPMRAARCNALHHRDEHVPTNTDAHSMSTLCCDMAVHMSMGWSHGHGRHDK